MALLEQKIKEAKTGNQKAFSYLLDVFWSEVYAFQLKRTDNENDAEDITIQAFSKAFDRIETYDENLSFKTWLIAISKNIHVDMIRSRQNSTRNTTSSEDNEAKTIADESPTIEDQLITEQSLNHLLTTIKQLKEPYRTVIQLRYLNEKSYKEIAKIMNISLSNVKVTLLRAKKILAELLKINFS